MSQIKLQVIKGNVLGVNVFRGYARLSDLSKMSAADIYDKKTNPSGTQRDLSPKHAKEAYDYINSTELGFWPEIFLCARNGNVIKFSGDKDCGTLTIEISKIEKNKVSQNIDISRVDGNHRLHYADGQTKGYPPIDKVVSFCLANDLKLEEEISLFRDINNNQRKMNTSHLDNIETRLFGEDKLKSLSSPLYIAKKLGDDSTSPMFNRIYDGGHRAAVSFIPLRSLNSGIKLMLSKATKLSAIPDAEARYKVIKNYFIAVKKWVPDAWSDPKSYITLRGAGMWAICLLGAEVIDRALSKGEFSTDSMYKILKSGADWDWSTDGDFQGYSGQGGASKISGMIVAEFADESGSSLKKLYKEIMMDK